MTTTHLIIRHRTRDDALRATGKLSAKYGRGRFFVIQDPAGGDFAPFAVCSFQGYES